MRTRNEKIWNALREEEPPYDWIETSMDEVIEMAESRNTSIEIVVAILLISEEKENFERIWRGDFTGDELALVNKLAFRISDEDELFWGDFETINREA